MKNKSKSGDTKSYIKQLARKAIPATSSGSQNLTNINFREKIDEVLYYINQIKNSTTINTGEFEALTRIFTGQKMYVDTRDISVAPHLMLDGSWEPEITTIFRSLVKSDDIVFDIGANFGYFGLVAGSTVGSKGEIHFIEANSRLIPYIRKSLSVNGLNNHSQIHNIALSDKEGFLELNILDEYWGSSSIHDMDGIIKSNPGMALNLENKQKVRSTSLDKLCKEKGLKNIDLIKIDIEGYEDVAYSGMKNVISSSPNLIMLLEFTSMGYKNPEQFFENIQRDFDYVYIIPPGTTSMVRVANYLELSSSAQGDWIMIVASKNEITSEFLTTQ